jgi:hypothetical protein
MQPRRRLCPCRSLGTRIRHLEATFVRADGPTITEEGTEAVHRTVLPAQETLVLEWKILDAVGDVAKGEVEDRVGDEVRFTSLP